MKKHLLFLGAPGAGKGTQAELLSQNNSYLHLSTGELFRKEIEMNTTLGIQVKDIMNRGELVSDELVLRIVRQNLVKDNSGWILDGYPRNLSQANSLNEVLIEINQPLEVVFYLDIPEEVLIKRLLLRGRKDDTEATIRTRVDIYKKTTEPLIQYFKDLSLIEYIDADRDLKTVSLKKWEQNFVGDFKKPIDSFESVSYNDKLWKTIERLEEKMKVFCWFSILQISLWG